MTELVGMGSLTQQQLEKAAGSTALAVQTGIVSAQDIAKAYKDIEKDPVKALQSLNEQYNFLTVSQLKHFFKLLLCQRSHANQLSHQTLNGSYSSASRGSNRLGGSHDLKR